MIPFAVYTTAGSQCFSMGRKIPKIATPVGYLDHI